MLVTKDVDVTISAREYADILSNRLEDILKVPMVPDYEERLGKILDEIRQFRKKATEEVKPEELGISPSQINMMMPPKPKERSKSKPKAMDLVSPKK